MADLTGEERARYVRSMFGGIVEHYDLMNTLMTFGHDVAWRRTTVRLVAPTAGGLALDVACGTGALTRELARWPFRRVVGLDFTPGMLAEAKRRASWSDAASPHRSDETQTRQRNRPCPAPTSWVNADALALPFPDDTFDCVTVGFGVRNFGDLERGLAEMCRVTKPGGRMACLECTPLRDDTFGRAARLFFHGLVPLVGQVVAGQRDPYSYLPASADRFPNAAAFARLLRAVGWADVRWRAVGLGIILIHHAAKPVR